jgi:hypothetical protein
VAEVPSTALLNQQHSGSVSLDLNVKDLVDFIGEYYENDYPLKMECSLFGDPLPCIRLISKQSEDLNARMEFSQQLATIFIQYVMKRGMPMI